MGTDVSTLLYLSLGIHVVVAVVAVAVVYLFVKKGGLSPLKTLLAYLGMRRAPQMVVAESPTSRSRNES